MPARATDLARAFGPVLRRRSGVAVALWGEAGCGKSRAAAAFLRELPCRTLVLPASASLQAVAAAVAGEAQRDGPARGTDASAIASLCAALSTLAPVVLHLDDLPGADGGGSSWVPRLAEVASRRPGVGVLVTARAPLGRPFRDLRLAPLSRDATAELLRGQVTGSLPRSAADWIHAEAAGNALFSLEYLRHLARDGFLWNDGRGWHWRRPPDGFVPPTVRALVEEALAGARTEAERRVMAALALLPPPTGTSRLARVTGLARAELEATTASLASRGIACGGDLVHPLFRRLAVHGVDREVRRELATRAVRVLRDRPEAAAPLLDDADVAPDEALALLTEAAERCQDPSARGRHLAAAAVRAQGETRGELALRAARSLRYLDPDEAARLAGLALAAPRGSPDAALLLAELLVMQGRAADAEGAVDHLAEPDRRPAVLRLRALAGDHEGVLALWTAHQDLRGEAGLAALAAAAMVEGGDLDAAERLVLARLHASDGDERAGLRTVLGRVRHLQGRFAEAADLLTAAVGALRGAGPSRELADALQGRAEVWQSLGDMRRKREDITEAVAIYGSLADPRSVAATSVKLGVLLLEEGEHAAAEEVLQASRDELERLGPAADLVECERMLCYLYRQRTLPYGADLARKYGGDALARARGLNSPKLLSNTLYEASYAESLAGFPRAGLELAEECVAACEAAGLRQTLVYALFARAYALERLGDEASAGRDLRRAAGEASALGLEMDAQTVGLELDRLEGDVASARRRRAWFAAHGQERRARMVDEYFPGAAPAEEPAQAPAPWRLEVLGAMRLRTPVGVTPVRGAKRRRLLALLLEARVAGRAEATRSRLLDELYPGKDERRAASSLKELVHGLRSGLSPGLVTTTANGYALGSCGSDAEEFLETLDTGLWRGHYQAGTDLELVGPVRETLHLRLRGRAEDLLGSRPGEAARVGRLLVEADPYDRRSLRVYLTALRRLSNHRTLARHYQAARAVLEEVGERLPERWQEFLDARGPHETAARELAETAARERTESAVPVGD